MLPAAALAASLIQRTGADDAIQVLVFRSADPPRDSDLFGEGVRNPEAQRRIQAAIKRGFQTRERKWTWAGCWASWPTADRHHAFTGPTICVSRHRAPSHC